MKSRQRALRLSCILTLLFSAITSAWASPGLIITPTTLPMCFTNVPYNQTLAATGGAAPYTFAVTGGSLPGGLALSTNGVLSGNPAPSNPVPGDPFTVTATDSIGATGSVVCYVPIYNERYYITTIAGLSGSAGGTDGTNGGARFSFPYGIALDSVGNVYVADRQNSSIRKLALSGTNWVVTTVAGLSGSGGSVDGTNTGARFNSPNFLTVDGAGNLYVADTGNNDIREITPSGTNWVVTTIAGTAGTNGNADGTNGGAQFKSPRGIAVDGAGNLFVADSDNDTIRKITPMGTNWVVTTIAGTPGVTNGVDGTNGSAHFTQPYGLAVDAAGNLFVADTFNDTIREITPSGTNWVVTTIAGTAGLFAVKPVDGTNSKARFWEPTGIAVDGQDNVYVADEGTFSLRQIQPLGTSWLVKSVAGGDLTGSSVDGVGIVAVFSGDSSPAGVASDGFGNVYLTDTGNDTIRKGVPEFVATLITGNVTNTYDGNPHPVPVATLPSGLPFTVNYGNGSTNAPVNAGKTIGVMVSVSSTTNYFASAFVNQFINPGTVSITFSNLVQAYDGTAKAVSVSGIPTNVPLLVAYAYPTPSSLNFNPPTNVGTYQVLSGPNSNNYSGISSNIFTITQGTAFIALSNLTQSYDGTPKSVTVTTVPPGLATVVTYNGSSNAPSNAGSYAVVASVVDSNYVGSVTNTMNIGGALIVLNCSSNISVAAPDASGAVVAFDVSGSGGCNTPDVEAVPPSGSTFPIGTTTVNVTATDSCGGSNGCTFTVNVAPPPTRMGLRLDGSLGLDIADHDPNPIDHILNGQTAPTAMPAAFLGSPVSRNFIIENTGSADLVVSGASVPAGYTVTSPSFPATVPASNYLALTIQQDAATNGYYAGSVVITNSSTNAPVFSFPIYGVTVDSGNKAEFAEHGSTLFLMVGAGVSVNSITHTATTATFSITAGGTTWAGTDSANVTANGSTDLVVTPAGSGVFTNVEVIATSSGAQPQFRLTDSTTNDVWPFSLKLDTGNAGANNVGGWLFVRGEENFGPHSLVLRSCFYINPSGQILTTSGNITMEADWENANKTFLNAHVVLNQASLSTVSGQILLRGYNINGLNNEGVADLGPITSTGTGAGLGHIIIRGHEEHNFPDEAVIVFAPITSVDADIDISGSVSANDGSGSQGIVLANTVTSMGHGNITMLGLGGTGDDIPGIDVPGGAISNAFGNITLTGQNRGGTTAPGIRLGSIFSVHGTVNLLPLTETGDPGTVEFTTAGATTLYFDTNNITTPKISVTGSVVIDPNASLHTIFGGPVGSESPGNVLRMISDNSPGYTGNFIEFPEGGPSILGQTPGTDTYLAGAGADLDFTIGDSETTPPEESVDIAATQDNPTTNLTINFTAVFTEPVNGFVADGLILGGTAAGPRAAVITELFPFDQTVYNIAVSGHTNVGTVTVALPDSVVTDVWGNLNLASTEGSCLYIPRGDAAPAITNVNKATFTAGADNSFTFTASGAPPVRILTGDFLPGGLVFTINDDGSAVLTGTPAAGTGGSYNLDLIFSNGVPPEAEEEFTLTINAAPVITSSNSTSFIRGQAGSFTVTSTGFPVSALSVGGALPPSGNIAFQAHGDGTASLAGTPTPADVGTYPLTITAANGTAPDATQNFTLVINPPPPIDLVCSTNMTAIATDASGAQVFFNLSASGGCDGPFVNALPFASGGEFPPGTTIEDVTATDDCGDTTNCSFTVTVYAAPLITSSNSTSFIGGQAGGFTVTSTGFPVSALSVGGALPPSGNIAFQAHGDGTASLAGTPTPADVGTYPLTITAANGTAPDATQNFTLVINPPPPIDLVCSTNMTAIATDASGAQVFFNLSASGGCDGPFVNALPFASGGEFPPGTTIEDVTATDDCGDTTNCSFTVTVYETPSITSANQTTFAPVSAAHSFTVTSAGFPTCALTLAGSLPPSGNITFHDNGNGTASLSGTPTPADVGTYPLTLTASNGIAANATQNFTLLVGCQNITVVPSFVPFCALNVPYLQANNGAGGSAPYTITLTGGALPPGLTLTNNGVLSGTPTNAGVYNFTLTGVDSNGCPGSTNLSVAVVPAVTVIFSSGSGTWTVPNVVSNAEIRMWGGGGGGGVNNRNGNFGGGGGGGGGYTAGYVTVVPGSHIAYAVGASGTAGVQGGTSTFTGLTAAGGGKAGGPTATGMGPGVPGGVGIGGTTAGGTGGVGSPNGGSGGTGGGPGGGTGGTGGTTGGGGAGSLPGGGGGGGGKSAVAMLPGGAGGAGQVLVIYVLPTPVFFNLTASQAAFYGQTIALSGTLSAAVPTGTLYPSNGETISVTIGSVVTNTTINDATGDFSLSCNLTGIPASAIPYPIKYAYGGDVSLNVSADASTALTLNPAPASVILTNLSQAYDGTPKSVTVTTVPPGLATAVTYNGSPNAPSNNGSYTVVATVVNSNYVGSVTNTLNIGSGVSPATVLVSNLVQTYDGTAKSVTVTTVPPGLATAVTYNGSPNAPTNAGSYTVIATVTDPSYTGVATNTLVVDQAPVFTSTNSATFNFALSNSFAVTAAGFPVPTLSAVSNLPTGMAFTDNGNGSAMLSGVPVPSYGKFFPLSFVASNSMASGVVTQSFQLTLDFVPYHPTVTNTLAIATVRNVPVTFATPFLDEVVDHTNDLYSQITAVDPTSFQGYGRIVWSNNAITYVPALDYTGADFFEYTATNAAHGVAGRVNVTVADGAAGDPLGVSVTPDTNGYLVVFASSNAGDIFNVEYRGTMEQTDVWLPLSNGLHTDLQPGMQTRGLILLEDRTSPSPTQRFYRVMDAGN